MENKKFLNGTELGSKREPATKASSAPAGAATGVIELRNDALGAVSGGYIFFAGDGCGGCQWEVIDDSTGEVLERYIHRYEAIEAAERQNQLTYEIGWERLDALRREARNA